MRIPITEDPESHNAGALRIASLINEGIATQSDYYWLVSKWARTAIGRWCQMRDPEAVAAAKKCVQAVLDYFYGDWRERLITMDGQKGETAWRKECLWLEEVQRSLPFASALSNWEAVKRIAAYPPEDMFPEAAKAKGEGAWGRAVLSYLRGEPRNKIEAFIAKAESKKTKRLILLGPVLRTLMDQHERKFADALLGLPPKKWTLGSWFERKERNANQHGRSAQGN